MKRTVAPAPASPGSAWTADSAWRVGAPTSVAASADFVALARGPKVEIGRLQGTDVVSTDSHVLPERVRHLEWQSGGLFATTRSGAWQCDAGIPRRVEFADIPARVRNRSADVGGVRWWVDRSGRLVSESRNEELALGSAAFQIVAFPRSTPLADEGWDLLVSAMDGLWLVDTSRTVVKHVHPRPARSLIGDENIWAVFDDEIRLMGSAYSAGPVVRFESPLSAHAAGVAVLVGTTDRTWSFVSAQGEIHLQQGASDILVQNERVVSVREGLVRCDYHGTAAFRALGNVGGESSRLIESPSKSVTLTSAPVVAELDGCLNIRRQWNVAFGPLAAVTVGEVVLICGGESGLYVGDSAGVRPLDLDIPAALDLCAVDGAVVVSTGAGVVRIEVFDEPHVTHRIDLPGVSTVSAGGGIVVALVEDELDLLTAHDLTPVERILTHSDPRRIRINGRTIVVCGYDAVEMITLD